MRPIHAFASAPHYVDHLAPIWHALDEPERGRFFAASKVAADRARALDIIVSYCGARMPPPMRTAMGGRQPHVLVASFGDLSAIAPRRAVLIEHGAGQDYSGDTATERAPWFAGGSRRGRVDVFLCPNEHVAERNRMTYPNAAIDVIGCSKLDAWARPIWRNPDQRPLDDALVAFAFHWHCTLVPEADWAYPTWGDAVVEWCVQHPGRGLVHAHPRARSHIRPWAEQNGVEFVTEFADVVERADVLVCDNSSVIFEWAALDRRVVLLDSPHYRPDVEHGLRFWRWANIGARIGSGDYDVLDAAIGATCLIDGYVDERRACARDVYGVNDGRASQRAVESLRRNLP